VPVVAHNNSRKWKKLKLREMGYQTLRYQRKQKQVSKDRKQQQPPSSLQPPSSSICTSWGQPLAVNMLIPLAVKAKKTFLGKA